jgi:hypothetical protein
LDKRITIPRELFQKCASAVGLGRVYARENNPVCVDNEAMRLLYEKLEMPVPVYPPAWADFWYACKTFTRKYQVK